jgi:hypothetical protein
MLRSRVATRDRDHPRGSRGRRSPARSWRRRSPQVGPPLKSATKTPENISNKSEVVGRGVRILAAPDAREVYHQFLPGPSAQKELGGINLQRKVPRVEGSEEEAIRHYNTSVMQALSSNGKAGDRGGQGEGPLQNPKATQCDAPELPGGYIR